MSNLSRPLSAVALASLSLVVACGGGQASESAVDRAAHHGQEHPEHHAAHAGGGVATSDSSPDLLVFDEPPPVGTRARCPVTGEVFAVSADTPHVEHEGRHYVLCCEHCRPPFEADPDSYVEDGGS